MSSELRVRCFLTEISRDQHRWNVEGEHDEVTRSLHELMQVLEDVSGDYTVKVMIHRKRDNPEETD